MLESKRHIEEKIDQVATSTGAFGPRIIMNNRTVQLENVKSVQLISSNCITVSHGKRFSSIVGRDFVIEEIMDERMIVRGEIEKIEFFGGSPKDKD